MTFGFLSQAGLSMALAGCFFGLLAVVMLVRNDWTSLKESLKSFKIAMGSTFRSTGRGEARLVPIILTVVCCLALMTVPIAIALAKYFSRYPIYELQNVHVDQQLSSEQIGRTGFHYWMTYDSESVGHIHFLATFCSDYTPQFEAGSTLKLLRYEDRGSCWGLNNEHTGYLIVRDENGKAIHSR
jgi:hypothetical protein